MQRLPSILAFLLCLGLIAFYTTTQERTEYREGRPYDGETYWHQARLVAADQPIRNWKPFCYRMGAPYVVGKWYPPVARALSGKRNGQAEAPTQDPLLDPDDPLDGFALLGFLSGLACVGLLFGILRTYGLRPALAWGLVAIYIANPIGPFRFSPLIPAFSDPLAFVFIFGLFLTYRLDRDLRPSTTFVLCVLGFFGAFVREIVLLVPLTFLGAHLWRAWSDQIRILSRTTAFHLAPIACIGFALWMTRLIVDHAMGEYTMFGHAGKILARNAQAPEIFPLALMIAAGPFVLWLLASLKSKATRAFLLAHKELIVFLVGMPLLALVGGNHTDRFVSWMLLGFLPWLGFLLQERVFWPQARAVRYAFFGLLLGAQILAYRAFLAIPNGDVDSLNYPGEPGYFLFSPYGEGVTWGQTIAAFMTRENRIPLLLQYAGLALALGALAYWDRRLQARDAVDSAGQA